MPKAKPSKTAAATASGKPSNNKPAAGKAAKAAAAATAAASAAPTGTSTDASQPAAAGDTTGASAPGTAGATTAPPAIDPNGINPATGKKWTVKELKAEMAKNAAIIQSGGKVQGATVTTIEPVKPIILSERKPEEITADWIVPAEGGAGFAVKTGMPVEEWAALVRHLDKTHENIGFAIGDLLNYGTKEYGKTYDAALAATGRSIKTLRNWKNVASSVAPAVRRLDVLGFDAHAAVASLPAAKQTEIIEKAVAEKLDTKQIRKLAKAAKPAKKNNPAPPSAPGAPHKEKLTDAETKLWEKAQEAMDTAATFLRGKVWAKLTKLDKKSVRGVLKMIAEGYEALVNELGK